MEKKSLIIVDREGGVSNSLATNRGFFLNSNLSAGDIWRSKMEGGRMIVDFEN